MPKLSKKSKNIWSAFVEWLSTKDIVTINDFDYQMKYKYHMTRDGIFLRQNVPEVWCFKRVQENGRLRYEKLDYVICTDEVEWQKVIAHRNENGRVEIYDYLPINYRTFPNEMTPPPFNQIITQAIIESKAFAASDASAKYRIMAGFWCIKDSQQQTLLSNTLFHKE